MAGASGKADLSQKNMEPQEYRQIIDNTPAGIIILKLGKEFEILYFSRGYTEMMEYTAEEAAHLLHQDSLRLLLPQDRRKTREKLLACVKSEGKVLMEYRKERKNGKIIWIRLRGQVVGEQDGCPILQCVLMDITEEKELQAELIQKENIAIQELEKAKKVFDEEMQYQEATQSDKLLVKVRSNITQNVVESYIARGDVGISADNMPYDQGSENLAMTGYTKEQQDTIRHMLDGKRVLEAYARGDYRYSIDYQRKTHDGKVIWVNTTVKTYADPETGDVKSFMYSYDIDDEMTLKIMLDKMMAMDYQMLGVYWPEAGKVHMIDMKMLGMEKTNADMDADQLHQYLMDHVIAEERQLAGESMNMDYVNAQLEKQQLEKQQVYTCAFTFFDENGRYRKKWQYSYMDESTKAIIMTGSDITQLFEQQEQAKEDLRRALDMARQANVVRANFLSRVSHDMRTPLNAILGFARFAQNETDPQALYDYARKIEESGEYLLNLINDTLDINRIETDTIQLMPSYVKSGQLLDQILHTIEMNAREKDVNFEVKLDGFQDVWMYMDGLRIQQILNNILSNAVKFTPRGGNVFFHLKVLSSADHIVRVQFVVEDTGIGMRADFLEKIFLPFSQEDETIRSNYKGTGLGMAIVKKMVDLLGGEIAITSEKGEGTKVTVWLDMQTAPDHVETDKPASLQEFDWRGVHVLVAEDHALNYEVVRMLLEKKGCQVDWAENGQKACEMFQASAPGTYPVILMDVRMPVMDGLEAVRRIRAMKHPDSRSVRIIMLTANAYEEDRTAGMDAGADLYMSKPIEPDRLYEAIAMESKCRK